MQVSGYDGNMANTLVAEPVLDKPGAGVPKVERFVGKWMLRAGCFVRGRGGSSRKLEIERAAIRGLYMPLSAEQSARRVLIPRLRGLEDSSRYWSVWMVLDHLRIVNSQVAMVIASLLRGVVPQGKADTAAVKPSIEVGAGVVDQYEHSCDRIQRIAESAKTLRTGVRFAHPWFGSLDAAEWHGMTGMHLAIHRKQIEQILRRMSSEQK